MMVADDGNEPRRGLSSNQLLALIDGLIRLIGANRPRWVARFGQQKLARAEAQEAGRGLVVSRRLDEEDRAQEQRLPPVARSMPPVLAALMTLVLMIASWFTVQVLLAVSDIPPVEAWLTPAAFGPVFVLGAKTMVSWHLGQTTDEKTLSRRQTLWRCVVYPVALVSFAGMVAGVAIKAQVIGSLGGLPELTAMQSSMLLFGSLAAFEVAAAAALAHRQHKTGAREYERAEYAWRWRSLRTRLALWFHTRATMSTDALRARLEAARGYGLERGRLGLLQGLEKAAATGEAEGLIDAEPVTLAAPRLFDDEPTADRDSDPATTAKVIDIRGDLHRRLLGRSDKPEPEPAP